MFRTSTHSILPLLLGSVLAAQQDTSAGIYRYVGDDDLGGRGSVWARSQADLGGEFDTKVRRRIDGERDLCRVRGFYRARSDGYRRHLISIYFDGNKITPDLVSSSSGVFANDTTWLNRPAGQKTKTYYNVGGFDVQLTTRFQASVEFQSTAQLGVYSPETNGAFVVRMDGRFRSSSSTNLDGGWSNSYTKFVVDQYATGRLQSHQTQAWGTVCLEEATYQVYQSVTAGPWWNPFGTTRVVSDDTEVFARECHGLQ